MPWDRGAKIKMVLTTILPMALYGCEVAAPAEKALEGLTRAIARAIGYHSTTTSNLLVYELASHHILKTASYIMLRRAQLMRRITAKHPDTRDRTSGLIQAYVGQGIMGTCTGPLEVEPPTCPPPTYGGRGPWTSQARSMGGPCGPFLHPAWPSTRRLSPPAWPSTPGLHSASTSCVSHSNS